jgi:hypothetical protein
LVTVKRSAVVAALLSVALALTLASAGCAGASAGEQKAACFANISMMQTEMRLFNADSGLNAPFATVVAKTGSVCPSGGKYSYDAATGVVSCSIHGHP